ncbi:MAG: hypothetical protein M1813_007957 [Trichoglossum hirsutum]|nr:MAG: hypothetical protein M1813_007957 [Trichoglossum hirsutum]
MNKIQHSTNKFIVPWLRIIDETDDEADDAKFNIGLTRVRVGNTQSKNDGVAIEIRGGEGNEQSHLHPAATSAYHSDFASTYTDLAKPQSVARSAWCGNSRQGANPAGKENTGAGTGSKSDAGLRGYTEARNEGACRVGIPIAEYQEWPFQGILKRTKIGNETTYNLEFKLPCITGRLNLPINPEVLDIRSSREAPAKAAILHETAKAVVFANSRERESRPTVYNNKL